MNKTRELLNAYARANGYEVGADFSTKKRTLSKDGTTLAEDQALGSPGFVGFCDGYQGRPHRYKGPAGSPEKSPMVGLLSAVEKSIGLSVPEAAAEDFRSVIKSIGVPADYDEQYRLGRSCGK